MKNLKAIMLLFLGLVLVACSSDDDGGGTPEPITGDYFPSTLADSWTYNVANRNADDSTFNFDETDLLTVNSSTASGFTVEANNGTQPAFGSMNSFLVNGTLSKTDDMLLFSGDLALPPAFSGFSDATITLTNAPLYSLNAANGELSNTSGAISQDLDIEGTIIPLTIDYVLTTNKLSTENTLPVGGIEYTDVIKGNISLEVSVVGSLPVLGNTTILETQDILSIDYYFAKDVGLIKAEAVQGYMVADTFIEIIESNPLFPDLGIPTTVSVTNNQDVQSP